MDLKNLLIKGKSIFHQINQEINKTYFKNTWIDPPNFFETISFN
jgi:hypothetical protein